jgi:hypothetical protein
MDTMIYMVWVLIPTTMFLLAVWDLIDSKARKRKDRHSVHLIKQSLFVFMAVACASLIDQFLLDFIVESVFIGVVSRSLLLVLLLPLILVIAATVIGPSKPITIGKVQRK